MGPCRAAIRAEGNVKVSNFVGTLCGCVYCDSDRRKGAALLVARWSPLPPDHPRAYWAAWTTAPDATMFVTRAKAALLGPTHTQRITNRLFVFEVAS